MPILTDILKSSIRASKNYTDGKISILQKQIDELKQEIIDLKKEQYDEDLYEILRIERNEIAKENAISPFCIFNNEILKELSCKQPINREELIKIRGIKDKRAEKYGDRFIQLITNYQKEYKEELV
jgi:ATP-dependent DNA helicase RecQ